MVNIQVWQKDENKKIETVRCDENETMINLEKLENKYGATQHSHIEKDTSKKTTMIRYYRESETHTIIISMSEHQAERVNDYLADYWEFVRLFDDEETEETETEETEGDEQMTEKYIGIKYLNTGNKVVMIIEAEDWDEALLKMGSITAFDDRVVDWTCDLATDEDVASAEKEEERKALELRLEHLHMMAFEYKKAGFGEHQVVRRTPYDDEIAEIKQKLGEF